MEDVFVERLITRKLGGKELAVKLGALLLALALAIVTFLIPAISFFAPLIILGAGWLGWIIWSRSSLEYEYSLSNGELTIDCIYGQQKRKHVAEVNLRDRLEYMAPVSSEHNNELNRQANKVLDVASSANAPGRWFMNVKGEAGLTRILFEPDERLVTAMRRCAPSKVKAV